MMTKDWLHGLFLRGDDEELDTDLVSLFSEAPGVPGPDLGSVARTRARVPAELRQTMSASGGLRRRLALGALGGGGAWATLIGTAAANKAAAVDVGLGVLLSGGAVLEVSGVGEAVREAVGIEQSANEHANERAAAGAGSATGEAAEGASGNAQLGVEVGDAPEGVPGQLVTQLHDDGAFSVRALLVDADEDSILIEVGDSIQYDLALDEEVTIQLSGQREGEGDEPTLEDLQALVGEGHLVFVRGTCDAEAEDLDDESCTVTSIVVSGNAGVGGPGMPEDAGMPEDPGSQAGDHPPVLPTVVPGSANGVEGAGQPDDPGQPDNTPPVSLPSTPGS